jgi:hypothetical protein
VNQSGYAAPLTGGGVSIRSGSLLLLLKPLFKKEVLSTGLVTAGTGVCWSFWAQAACEQAVAMNNNANQSLWMLLMEILSSIIFRRSLFVHQASSTRKITER